MTPSTRLLVLPTRLAPDVAEKLFDNRCVAAGRR